MPKRHLEAHTQSERAKQRQRLGSPKDLTVQPATRVRYNNAVDHFLQFLNTNNLTLPKQRQHLDPLVCEFLEYLWSQGYGRARASDAVAGLQDQDPKLRGHLQGAWRLLKAWNLHEIPSRAPPLPEHVLHAMVGWAFFHQHFSFGVSARIYINEGLAVLAELQLPKTLPSLSPFLTVFSRFRSSPTFQTLEPPCKHGSSGGRGRRPKKAKKNKRAGKNHEF